MTHPMLEAMRKAGGYDWRDGSIPRMSPSDRLTDMANGLLDHLSANITDEQIRYAAQLVPVPQAIVKRVVTAYLAAVKKELEQGQ